MSDEQKCPLCDQPNRCAMAEDESISACWCTSIRLTEDMLGAVPAKDRGVRCVCATCARALATASPNQALHSTAPLRHASDVDVNQCAFTTCRLRPPEPWLSLVSLDPAF
jgi:hypothetical protein